jgi:TolB-like protein/Tfp pilus assembly protein PilF/predicted Ser/Thr protein kinase
MKCSRCQAENPSGSLACVRCGASLAPPPPNSPSSTMTLQFPSKKLPRGTRIADRFEVLEELGRGGMGTVYRVLDRKINEEIALKLLKPEVAADVQIVERFKNELKLARKIIHKNICRLYDINEAEGALFITMEYVKGENLKSLIQEGRPVAENKAVAIVAQVGEGLAEAHRLGVVHRDLKPQNIMLDEDGGVHIMDFGIARLMGGSEMTEAGTIIGTPDYMSPEQVEGRTVDPRSDVYSLGVILYEMVTGCVPFTGETALSVAVKQKMEKPADPRTLNPRLTPAVAVLILRCLEKSPEARPQRAEDFLAELQKISEGAAGGAALPAAEPARVAAGEEAQAIKSIAVLPFKDMSPQRDQDYFCEGLAEELINALTQVKDLRVAARTSSFSFKGKETDIREIGRLLNVGTLLEGSVQKAGDRLRVTAQLINVADGYHILSQRFDRTLKDIFAVQDEISLAIVDKLKVELLAGEKEKMTKRHTMNEAAYNMYIKGRYFWNRRYQGDMIKAVVFYEQAIRQDANYALPYVGIADVFNILGLWAYVHPRDASTKIRAALQKALEIDNELSEAHTSLGFFEFTHEHDFAAGEHHLRRSIELNPANAYAHGWYAIFLGVFERYGDAVAEARRAAELDPLFSLMRAIEGLTAAIAGQVEEGRRIIHRAIEMDPSQPMPYLFLGMFYLLTPANPLKAIELLQQAVGFGLNFALGWLGLAFAMAGNAEEALKILARLERLGNERYLPAIKKVGVYLKPSLKLFRSLKKKYVSPMLKGIIYYGLNRQEDAIREFEKSLEVGDFFLASLFGAGLADLPWRQEFAARPECQSIRKRLGLP